MKKLVASLIAGAMLLQSAISVFAYDYLNFQPPKWVSQVSDSKGTVGVDAKVKKEGEVSLVMTTTSEPGASGDIKVYQSVTGLESSASYTFTFWTKAENVSSLRFIRSSFYNNTNISNSRTSWDWEKKEISFTLSSSATTAELRFTLKNASTGEAKVWIDNCSLVKEGSEENLLQNAGFENDVDLTAPANVSDLQASAKEGNVTLTWTDPTDADFRKVLIYDGELLLAEVSKGVCEWRQDGLENGQEYTYSLCTKDEVGNVSEKLPVTFIPKAQRTAPEVTADDENNVIIGIDSSMEYSIDNGAWVAYSQNPDLSGSHIVYVRYKAVGEELEGKKAIVLFTTNKEVVKGSISASMKNGRRNVSYQGSASADRVTVVAQLQGSLPYENVVYIREALAEEGTFLESFLMPEEAERGDYVLVIRAKDTTDEIRLPFLYIPDGDITSFIGGLGEADIESALLGAEGEEILKAAGINVADLKKLDNLDNLEAAILAMEDQSIDTFVQTVGEQTAIGLIQKSQSNQVLEILENYNEDYLKLSFEEKSWDELTDNAQKAYISKYLAGKELNGVLEDEYALANILYQINELSYASIGEVIETYAEELGVADESFYTTYQGLSESKQTAVLKEVKTAKNEYLSAEEFASRFETAVKNANKKTNTGNGGGGGGGGSYKTAGETTSWIPVSNSTPVVVAPDAEEEEALVFPDLADALWAKDAITALYNMNIVSGMGNGSFMPNAPVTREQFVKMAAEAFEIMVNEEELIEFADVVGDRWSYPAVSAMSSNQLVMGYPDNTFRPEANITREDIAVIIVRICEHLDIKLKKTREAKEFADNAMLSEYAQNAMEKLYCSGIINGVDESNIAPKEQATRAMAARLIYSVMEVYQ